MIDARVFNDFQYIGSDEAIISMPRHEDFSIFGFVPRDDSSPLYGLVTLTIRSAMLLLVIGLLFLI